MAGNSILSSSKEADKLNERVEKKIAEHLFIFYRYSPDYFSPPSPDGKYFLAVENLYSIFIDTGWVINYFWRIFSGKDTFEGYDGSDFAAKVDTKALKEIKDIVIPLRTLQGHTTSSLEAKTVEPAEDWYKKCLGTYKPRSLDHYSTLLEYLYKYADEIKLQCTNFIDFLSEYIKNNASEKDEIIHRWEVEIMNRFTVKQDLFDNAVDVYYRGLNLEENYLNLLQQPKGKAKRDQLIISYFYYDIEQLEKNYSDDKAFKKLKAERLEEIKKVIDGSSITCVSDLRYSKPSNGKALKDYFYKKYFKALALKHISSADGERSIMIEDIVVNMLENEEITYPFMKEGEKPIKRFITSSAGQL